MVSKTVSLSSIFDDKEHRIVVKEEVTVFIFILRYYQLSVTKRLPYKTFSCIQRLLVPALFIRLLTNVQLVILYRASHLKLLIASSLQ